MEQRLTISQKLTVVLGTWIYAYVLIVLAAMVVVSTYGDGGASVTD